MNKAPHIFQWRMPLRERLQIPDSVTGDGVCAAVLGAFIPSHPEIVPEASGRDVRWFGRDGEPYDAEALTRETGRGEHDLQVVARGAGTGFITGGRYAGVAPGCRLVLSSTMVSGGKVDRCDAVMAGDEQFDSMMPLVERHGIATLYVGRKGRLSGPLLPWQWDYERRKCEELVHRGVAVISGTGNQPGSFCPQSLSPSVLSVGGIALPLDDQGVAGPFHSPEGLTFEGKPVPDVVAPAEHVLVPRLGEEHGSPLCGVPEGCTLGEGTSFAAPVILGLIACLMEARPGTAPSTLARALRTAARRAKPGFGKRELGLPTWGEVLAALDEGRTESEGTPAPFEEYRRIQAMSWEERLQHAQDRPAQALLNCLPECAPPDQLAAMREEFGRAKDARVRAAIVLLSRPGADRCARPDLLDAALHDPSPLVMGAALEIARGLGDAVHRYRERLIELINCSDLSIRHEALRVVEAAPDEAYVPALVEGMPMDIGRWPTSAFFTRRTCLKAITGHSHWPETRKMLPGECVFSEYWVSMQKACMGRWVDWLSEDTSASPTG